MHRHILTVTAGALRRCGEAARSDPDRIELLPAGLSRLPGRSEWLVHSPRAASGDGSSGLLAVAAAAVEDNFAPPVRRVLAGLPHGECATLLVLGVGRAAGRVAAVHRHAGGELEPVSELRIVGPGLPAIALSAGKPVARPGQLAEEVWSRTIGALGEAAWRRLAGLHVGLVGCGRSGSLAAVALRRLGVRRLTLIDPDRLEPHNVAEADGIDARRLGESKAAALADLLWRLELPQDAEIVPLSGSVLALSSLAALKPCDIIFTCVDSAAARLAAAALAALYLKPHIDVGAGIFHLEGRRRDLGADIRLLLPGRCLCCLGGIAGLAQAAIELTQPPAQRTPSPAGDWRRERAGSLRSLNALAVNFALRLFEDLAAGRLAESTWLRLQFSDAGIPRLDHRQPRAPLACPICRLAGRGDHGLGDIPLALSQLSREGAPRTT